MHGYCATIANFDAILKNVGASDDDRKNILNSLSGLRRNSEIAKINIPTLRNEFWYFALDVDKLFDLDTDKGIEDAREKLRELRDQFVSLGGVTEQEKIRIQAMNNQDNCAKYFQNC